MPLKENPINFRGWRSWKEKLEEYWTAFSKEHHILSMQECNYEFLDWDSGFRQYKANREIFDSWQEDYE